jgi:hypothetical protein
MTADRLADAFEEHVGKAQDVAMAYGRVSVAPQGFMHEAILTAYHREGRVGEPSETRFPEVEGLTRVMFRGEVGSNYGKWLRWMAERYVEPLADRPVFRNQLLSEPVEAFENLSQSSTDILHEYFVPPRSLARFIDDARSVIQRERGDLLNVTVRDVRRDDDTFLRYADQDMFAVVMLFNQKRSTDADAAMERMTRALVDVALRHGGRFYLPYRTHATAAIQKVSTYPKGAPPL